jgi:serine protease Do
MAKTVMEQLLQDGKVRRGMLGNNIQNITADTAKALELSDTTGVLVSNVRGGSAADKAGIKRGDIITAINGEKIEDSNVLRNKVAGTVPGTAIKLTIIRDGKVQELTATLDEFNVEQAKRDNSNPNDERNSPRGNQNGKLGLSLQPITPDVARQLDIPDNSGGLVVTELDPNGPAAAEGIARGDVILEINRQPVSSVDDVQSALDRSGNRPILLLINRRGQTIYLTVRPE